MLLLYCVGTTGPAKTGGGPDCTENHANHQHACAAASWRPVQYSRWTLSRTLSRLQLELTAE